MNTAPASLSAERHPAVNIARRFRKLSAVMLMLLLAQVLLGMANNLWLSVPDSGSAWEKAAPSVLIYSHIVLGVSILAFGIWTLVAAIRTHTRLRTAMSVFGLVGILGAAFAGSAFMNDTTNDAASFLMATGCTVSIGAYPLGLATRGKAAEGLA